MIELGKRLKRLRIELDLKQGEFADKIELSQGVLSEIEHGKKPLVDRNIKLICLTFDVNEIWLRTGRGEMFRTDRKIPSGDVIMDKDGKPLTKDEMELIGIYRGLIPANKKMLLQSADIILKTEKNTVQDTKREETEATAEPHPDILNPNNVWEMPG